MRVNSRTRPRGENASYWTSYSDMMAGLMLVFTLLTFFFIFQFLELQETKTAELATKESQIESQQSIVLDAEARLADREEQLRIATATMDEQQRELDQQKALVSLSEIELAKKQEDNDEKNALLLTAQQELENTRLSLAGQQELVTAQQDMLSNQQQRIEQMVGVRSRIIQSLGDALTRAKLDVAVDHQTGSITLKSSVLFDTGKADLKPEGMALLNQFIPVYVRTLLAPENRDFVGEIIIEGHADTTGTYLMNLDLSQRRALAVSTYCQQPGFGGLNSQEQQMLQQIMSATGRSFANPVYNADGSVNMDASRRVEFKFRLKDSEMIDDINRILENSGGMAGEQ